jgi:Fe2+ or Zn2+ uptake regulation protein
MRFSRQRERIKELVQSTNTHPTAEWVYETLKPEIPGLSLGTVYRNLKNLADQGAIGRCDMNDGKDHFDYRTDNHYHFVCRSCGKIFDLEIPVSDILEKEVENQTRFKVSGHSTRFYGFCNRCG